MDESGSVNGLKEASSDSESESEEDESESEDANQETSTLTRNEVKKLLNDLRKREKAGKVKNTGINTGGAKGSGNKIKDKAPKIKSTEDYANRFKVSIPLREALRIKPNLRGYVANLIADVAHERGLPIRIVKGT
jgi:hypothetical protein